MMPSIIRKFDGPRGSAAVAKVPAALTSNARRYHRRRLRVVSATGAQSTFQTDGATKTAISSAPWFTVIPRFLARKASAMLTKPRLAPNGAISFAVKTAGCRAYGLLPEGAV